MARSEEFVGIRTVHVADAFGEGQHAYSMHLTDERIVRCRDCRHRVPCDEGFFVCNRGWKVKPDHENGTEHLLGVEVEPDGFCAWAKERGAE